MATKEDIIWFSGFLNKYGLGLSAKDWFIPESGSYGLSVEVDTVKNSKNSKDIKMFLEVTSNADWDKLENKVCLDLKRRGYIRVWDQISYSTLTLPQAETLKELKMKIELGGKVDFRFQEYISSS